MTHCTVTGCESPTKAKGLCGKHYLRSWRGQPVDVDPTLPTGTPCRIDGCEKLSTARGWCQMHYRRWKQHGDPNVTLAPTGTIEERLLARSERRGECLLWTGPLASNGYGQLQFEGELDRTHRWAYRVWVGPIPEGAMILHSCDTPMCMEPTHLRAGTAADNMRDSLDRGRRPLGVRAHNAVFTEDQVREILQRRAAGEGVRPLAREFGVTLGAIGGIVYGKTWRHIPRQNHSTQQEPASQWSYTRDDPIARVVS